MYRIYFSVNNNEEVVTLPLVPESVPMALAEQHNETYEGLSRDYRRIGTLGLRSLEWSCWFPVIENSQGPMHIPVTAYLDGWLYIDFFERWRDKKLPFRVVIMDNRRRTILNMPCTVDSLEWEVERNGWIAYTISITEYRFIT